MKFDTFIARMKRIQEAYRAANATGDKHLVSEALRPLDETQAFWFVPTSDIWLVDYQTVGGTEDIATQFTPRVQAYSVEDQRERPKVNRNFLLQTGTRFFSNNAKNSVRSRVQNGVYDTRKAYLTMAEGKSCSSLNSLTS